MTWTGKRDLFTVALILSNITLLLLFYKYEVTEWKCIGLTINQSPCNILLNKDPSCPEPQPVQPWSGCPDPDDIFVMTIIDGRLGNLVWEYLSTYVVAHRYGLWPVMTQAALTELGNTFENMSVPALEDVARRCGIPALEAELANGTRYVNSQGELLVHLETPRKGLVLLKFPFYIVNTEELLPWWRQLRYEMKLRPNLKNSAQRILTGIGIKIRGPRNVTMLDADPGAEEQGGFEKGRGKLEFVGVHVRRTDYMNHMSLVYPGARVADHRFFLSAMQWMRDRLPDPLAFVVVSDDPEWCIEHLAAEDVIVAGSGNPEAPGTDLALLGACNHTIFAYGTFGLTAAMLANGRYTLIYDTQNGTNTKEMEFANFLPGWHILDDQGESHYQPGQRAFPMTYLIKTGLG